MHLPSRTGGALIFESFGKGTSRYCPSVVGAGRGYRAARRGRAHLRILSRYARCSTDRQDFTAQRRVLGELGVGEDRVYLDYGTTGTNRAWPGLEQALAAVRSGETVVVPKLDQLARSVPDARAISDSLAARRVRLSLSGTVYDPTDPMGKCLFKHARDVRRVEVDVLRMRTREGMAIAKANGSSSNRCPFASTTMPRSRRSRIPLTASSVVAGRGVLKWCDRSTAISGA